MSTLKNGERLFRWPLAQHIITAGWLYNSGTAHGALDFRAAIGTPVYAAEDGTVDWVQNWNGWQKTGNQSYGNLIRIRHADYKSRALRSLYGHLSKIIVVPGQRVKEGQLIGYSGETGNCFGAHLHFEVQYGGCGSTYRVNPLNWLDADFTCANADVKAHLGRYTSVIWLDETEYRVLEDEPADAEEVTVWVPGLVVQQMSAGDYKQVTELLDRLKLKYKGV